MLYWFVCLFKYQSNIVETCDSIEKKNNKADFAERNKIQYSHRALAGKSDNVSGLTVSNLSATFPDIQVSFSFNTCSVQHR